MRATHEIITLFASIQYSMFNVQSSSYRLSYIFLHSNILFTLCFFYCTKKKFVKETTDLITMFVEKNMLISEKS